MIRDAVVVGGGHNGLVAAAYLAKGGLKPLVLERRPIVGGAAVTEEFHPGFRNSTASYVVSLLRPEIIRDLELKKHGFETIRIKGSFGPFLDGRSLLLTGDRETDQAEIGRFSNRDHQAMLRFNAMLREAGNIVRAQMLKEPPRLGGGVGDLLSTLGLANRMRRLSPEMRHRFLQLFTTGVGHLLDRWFDSEAVKMMYGATATAGSMVGLYEPGSAVNLLHLGIGEVDGVRGAWALAKGGMGAITQAMAASAKAAGAEIRTDAGVQRILVSNGQATGLLLDSGEEIEARVVLANTDPKRTFLTLVGEDHLDPEFAADLRAYKMGSGSFRMNLALAGLPEFSARPGQGPHQQCFIRLVASYGAYETAYRAAMSGELPPEPIIDALIPSTLDDSLAPPGCHVMSLLCQHYPYVLAQGRSWETERERAIEGIIAFAERFFPDIRKLIVGVQAFSPVDLERVFGLTGGDVYHGRLDPDQLFSLRPHPAAAAYRTPIRGLYLCGAGAHPGGGVSGAPGHNAARRVLKDWRRL
jgi:phytoene dehydrogenase-like protein